MQANARAAIVNTTFRCAFMVNLLVELKSDFAGAHGALPTGSRDGATLAQLAMGDQWTADS
jgi:hypothetical protein